MKRTCLVVLGILALLLNLNFSKGHASDSYKLKYKMKKGTTLNYTMESKMESLQEVMGSEVESTLEISAKVNITSEGETKDGNLTYLMVYESMLIELSTSMMDSTLDNPEGLIGKRVRKTIAPNGDQIESVELDSIDLGMLGRGGGMGSAREFLANLPEAELKTGQAVSQTDVDSLNTMGGITVSKSEVVYTLAGKEAKSGYDCLKIDVKGTVNIEGDGLMQGMKFFIEGDGDIQSTLYFAPKEGLLVAAENQMDMEMTAAVTGQMSMTIPITQSQTSSMTLVK